MNRREFLASSSVVTASGIGGCVNSRDSTNGGEAAGRTVSVGTVVDPSEDYGVAFTVAVLNPTMDASQTARIEITMQNVSQELMIIPTGNKPVFTTFRSDGDTPGLILYTESDRKDVNPPKDGCWTVDELKAQEAVVLEVNLQPDEQQSTVREVLVDGKYITEDCPPSGEYRFSTSYGIWADPHEQKEYRAEFDWAFALELE